MQPKIIFLGTGGDDIVVGKQLRSSGGIVIQAMDNQIHLDPGPGAVTRAKDFDVNLRNNIAVLVSNNFLNKAGEVNAVISAMSLGGLDKKGVLVINKSAYNGFMDMSPMINRYYKNFLEKDIILEAGKRLGVNEMDIVATRTHCHDEDAIGFRITTPNFSVGYTSNTGYSKTLGEDFYDVDIMIFSCIGTAEEKNQNQLNTEDVIKLIGQINPKLAIITDFGIKMHESDVINEARKIQKATKVQTIAAQDGMVLNPLSYSVNLRQRTLNLFNK